MNLKNAVALATIIASGSAIGQKYNVDTPAMTYPISRKSDQVDDYHGIKVADPYRWLEDANSADTASWVEAQNSFTQKYLSDIPARDAIRARLTKLWNFERYSVPFKEGERYFYSRNDGLQNQAVLYTLKKIDETPRVLLDPNQLTSDGTAALSGFTVSPDGKSLAYGISVSGSDWQEWKVRDVETGKDLSDQLKWVKFSSASWTRDGKGFFYSRYDEPNEATKLADINYFQKLYFHKLGTPQSDDVLIYDRPDRKEWSFDGKVTDDGKYLIISIGQGTARMNRVYYKDLTKPDSAVVVLLDQFDAAYTFIDNDGPVFWFSTDKSAPRGRIIKVDLHKPAEAQWKAVVPETPETLQRASIIGGKLVVDYLKDARSQISLFDLDGTRLPDVALPGIGSVGGFSGKHKQAETFYSFTNFNTPAAIYRYDMASGKSELFRQPTVDFDPFDFETRQVFVTSKDGTKVPMFVVHKKGLKLDSSNPTYLYGYGGFNISLTPAFSVSNLTWMEMGGVLAIANLRGGGEYGKSWHDAGTKMRKQNVFDDFIASAEWLIANGYTSSTKLAIGGGSNGGLLVGAAMTQRPELFAAALPAVGVMDMLRFHRFTIGWAWASDYGSSDNADEFKALFAYSPLHNLKPGTCYPATMITTADHDDRVVPAHSFKFAAAAQAAQAGPAPILIRIETKAGHGAGKPTTKQIEEVADRWAFLSKVLDMPIVFK